VLPFENRSGDPELEYLSDGIADSIISSLSQIADLRVMSSSSVRRYKGSDTDPQVVADELGVQAVLLGRLLQPGDTFSIRVELVNAQDNTQIWGEQYTRQLDEILALQAEIAREISEKLRLQISGEDQGQLAKQGTTNPEAYQDYLRGRYHSNKRAPADVAKGIEYFNKAIDKDPNYARAYSGLADSYYFQALYMGRTVNDFYERELSAAQKALELDDTLAEAHTSMGRIMGHAWDWSASEEHLRRAIELDPNYDQAHMTLGTHLARQGRLDEGIAEVKKAVELDPVSTTSNTQLGRLLLYNGQLDEAIEQLETMFEETGGGNLFYLVHSYWQKGMHQEAIEWAGKSVSLQGRADPRFALFLRQMASDNRVDAMRTIENRQDLTPRGRAQNYAWLGEKDLAIEWFTKAIDERYHGLGWANVDPRFDSIRDDPRFHDLLRRINLEPWSPPVP